MTLEATLILLDNSDHSRNGDYVPTRWDAQNDAAGLIANSKLQSHPESAVGLMTIAGRQCEILATPTTDHTKIMACFHGVRLGGSVQFSKALQIAKLALKHRLNKAQRQRIIVFIASPIKENEQELVNLAKKMKKDEVAVDIIDMCFIGEEHKSKLDKFIDTVKKDNNSNIIHVPPGIELVCDTLIGTPIISSGNMGRVVDMNGKVKYEIKIGNNDFGGEGAADPELEMALRISLETEKERKRKEEESKKDADKGKIEEENKEEKKQADNQSKPVPLPQGDDQDFDDMDEEELMKRARDLSLNPDNMEVEKQPEGKKEEAPAFQDDNFINDLLDMIPDLDKDDPKIKDALGHLREKDGDKEKKEEEKK